MEKQITMHTQLALFYILSSIMLVAALLVIVSKRPTNSAFYLIIVFTSLAGLFLLIDATLAALLQILVYAGAVMVLFLFVVMLLNIGPQKITFASRVYAGGTLAFAFSSAYAFVVFTKSTSDTIAPSTMKAVLQLLFSRYALPFELIAILLLACMIGIVLISKQEAK